MRAVHIEIAPDLSTSFINALRKFIGRRGKPRKIFSDNGTNLVGAEKELRKTMDKLDSNKVDTNLSRQHIKWQFNPPYASHMSGVWERLIRSIRRVLRAMLLQHSVSDNTLLTLMIEIEAIMNSRPLTPVLLDPDANVPLTPNHLLLLRGNASGFSNQFSESDTYSSRRWRQVQHLAHEFWRRCAVECLSMLQLRTKWLNEDDNFELIDIVLVHDQNAPRGSWPLGKIIKAFPDQKKTRAASACEDTI